MATLARRGTMFDSWQVVRACQGLVASYDPETGIDATLAVSGAAGRRLRARIRAGVAAHVARGDRENLAANLALAVPARRPRRRWTRHLPAALAAIAGLWTRSWFVAASVFGWAIIAWIVVASIRRRSVDAASAAWGELDRIRIMVAHREVQPALRLWRTLRARGPSSQPVADAIADGACAIELLAGDQLAPDQRRELAVELVDLVPYLSRDCAFDAAAAIRRLALS
ncbi:MAG TPA: hypothetical protein VLX92_32210 [Kofleriaceae bacterium]|nr:hypothetical protein [Kofleriaceae bacterium]